MTERLDAILLRRTVRPSEPLLCWDVQHLLVAFVPHRRVRLQRQFAVTHSRLYHFLFGRQQFARLQSNTFDTRFQRLLRTLLLLVPLKS